MTDAGGAGPPREGAAGDGPAGEGPPGAGPPREGPAGDGPPGQGEGRAQCALHPDLPATAGTCVRCGTYMCGGCLSPSVERRLCLPCYDRVVGRGRAHHLPTLGVLTIVNGALMLALGLMNLVTYFVMFGFMASSATQDVPPEAEGMFWGIMVGAGLLSSVVHLVPGALQIWSGWRMRQRVGRTLAIVALSSGLATLLGCYCFPTSLALFIWGLMILLDDGTREVMAANEATAA